MSTMFAVKAAVPPAHVGLPMYLMNRCPPVGHKSCGTEGVEQTSKDGVKSQKICSNGACYHC